MLRYLIDPANAITATGLAFAITGLFAVLSGHFELGLAAVIWSLLADHLDGIVAGRTRNRNPDKGKIGKQLDSFTDLVSDAVFPAILVIQLNRNSPISLVVAIILMIAAALRLSYFNSFGLSGGRFVGVPLSYDIPVLALLFVIRPAFPADFFPFVVDGVLLLLAVLHVSTIRVPRTTGALLAGVVIFSITASVVLASRALT
jgi:CDP-diacylglycerol---serine O-phosphatidyltransferase